MIVLQLQITFLRIRHDSVAKFLHDQGATLVMHGNTGGNLMCKVRVWVLMSMHLLCILLAFSSFVFKYDRQPLRAILGRSSDLWRTMFRQMYATVMVELHW
jgi:hypothetical protein